MASKEPWEQYPSIWKTKAAFFTYLRGHLRLLWSRYPAKLRWKSGVLVAPPRGYTGRAKKLGECHYCNEMFAASSLEVDHVSQAGTCNSWETAAQFLHNLLDCNDNWVLACKPCHKIKSHSEKKGLSFKEAEAEKQAIEYCKKDAKEVIKFLLDSGYTTSQVSNATKRRALVEAIFKEKLNV